MKVDLPYIIKINPLIVILGSLFVILIPFLTWASIAKLEQISRAKGIVIATAKKQEIQSANDGVIEEIFVVEGQSVKKDEVIAKLDQSQFQASYEAIKSKVAALESTIARLKAEVFKKEMRFTTLSIE